MSGFVRSRPDSESAGSASRRSGRRSFLRNALLGGGVAAVASAASAGGVRPEEVAPQSPRPRRSGGYRETPVIRQYYDLARQI